MLARLLGVLLRVFSKEKTGYTRRNFWGHSVRYNKEGEKVGWSRKNFWGGRNRYNKNDELTSYTMKNFWGGYNTYDPNGNLIKKSYKNFWGGHNTYDTKGNLESQTVRNIYKGVDIYEGETQSSVKTKEKKVLDRPVKYTEPVTTSHAQRQTGGAKTSTVPKAAEKPVDVSYSLRDIAAIMPIHEIDNTISYFSSIEEAVEHYDVPNKFVKILAFSWGEYSDVPALAFLIEDMIHVVPLMRNVNRLTFPKVDLVNVRKEIRENISFEEMENSFLELGISSLGKVYEPLFPEYCFNGLDGSIDTFLLPCGLSVTEASLENLKNL